MSIAGMKHARAWWGGRAGGLSFRIEPTPRAGMPPIEEPTYDTGSDTSFRWSGSRVVFVPTSPDALGPRSQRFVVLDPARGATEINLPSPGLRAGVAPMILR